MKPVDFELHRPETIEETVALLAEYGEEGKVLAGGQSLVPLLNFRLARPEHVIDLGRVQSLTEVRLTPQLLSIGAMVTYARAERSPEVAEAAPMITRAIPNIAHQAIRARGTVGGSVSHGDPAAELTAVAVALDATMIIVGPRGTREVPARDFFIANLVTSLEVDEVLTEVRLPPCGDDTGAAFEEVARRQGDFALVGAGAQIQIDEEGAVADARICLTGVSSKPYRASQAENLLVGHPLTPDRLESAAHVVRANISPHSDLHATADYRRDVAGTLVSRAVEMAAARAVSKSMEGTL